MSPTSKAEIKNIDHLGIVAGLIDDDKIGRVMDKLYKYGLNNLLIEIVLSVIKKFNIGTKYSHLDATSFHLHGEYKSEENQEIVNYGGIKQVWLIVESQKRKDRNLEKLDKKLKKEKDKDKDKVETFLI